MFARADERLDDDRIGIVNLADLVRDQVEERRPLQPHGAITCHLEEEVLVRGDEHLLGLATANLLDNAIKHATRAGVTVSGRIDGNTFRLQFENAGTLPASPDHLFEPFQRAPDRAKVPGFGLGLALARKVARAHGGEVELATRNDLVVCILSLPLVACSQQDTLDLVSVQA
ncbi:MAG: sensor histidine kinase [Myxococcota bacterium]